MQIFYVPDISGNRWVMDQNESRHCIRVLRMTKGDTVMMVDGKGNLYEGFISNPDPGCCEIDVTGIISEFEKRSYRLHIAISPLKNNDRFEWFIEKSVEIGVDEITPLICTNTEKPRIKPDRVNKLIIAAMKQSLKAYRPILNDIMPFEDFVRSEYDGHKMIAHCIPGRKRAGINEIYKRNSNAVILIGPEGDFTNKEVDIAINAGFSSVHLGNSRLRTETAGVAACHSFYFINQ